MIAHVSRLHLEPLGGVAGDMILGALLDLGAPQEPIMHAFASMNEPGLELKVERTRRGDVEATYVRSIASGTGHVHRHRAEVHAALRRADVSKGALERAIEIFDILCGAEAIAHNATLDSVHLHEVGELDSIMDVLGIVVAMESLGSPEVTCASLPSGRGTVETQHGTLDCPVPAVVAIAERYSIPLKAVELPGETITPTGIAVLAAYCRDFDAMNFSEAECIGYGAGTKHFESTPNVVCAMGWS